MSASPQGHERRSSEIADRLRADGIDVAEFVGVVSVVADHVTYQTDGGGTFSASVPLNADLGPVAPDERLRERLREIAYEKV